MLYLYKRMRGINLPHSAAAQSRLGKYVAREELQPGDLVFFAGSRKAIGHVGMYIGENRIVHAANHVKNVRIDTLTGYYDRRYRGARRLTPTPFRIPADELRQLDPIQGDGSQPPAVDGP
jgi:cell wall-associated NlpC family hydrolase